MRHLFSIVIIFVVLSGCALTPHSIYRRVELDKNPAPSLLIDAKQRLITNQEVTDRDGTKRRIICAEPSPDVATGISSALEASLSAASQSGNTVDGSFGYSSAEAVAQLGERLATIQLLRDELADLCRAYSNGAITETHYTLRLSKLDDKMVTLLMGEMAAGAFGRSLAGIGGGANSGLTPPQGSDADVTALRGQLTEQAKVTETAKVTWESQLKTAQAEADPATKKTATESASNKEALYKGELAKLTQMTNQLRQAELQHAASLARAEPLYNPGELGYSPSRDGAVAGHIAGLQQAYLDSDDLTTLLNACIASLDRTSDNGTPNESSEVGRSPLRRLCEEGMLEQIQDALIAQQVRQTQLRALKVEQASDVLAQQNLSKKLSLCTQLVKGADVSEAVKSDCQNLLRTE